MKVIKPQKLGLLTRCFENRRRYFFSVGILALHNFSRALASEADMWKFLAGELGKDGVPDAGMPKSRAEFLVTGSAFQENGQPEKRREVRVRVGSLEKRLQVFGSRYWQGREPPTAAEPFVEMPITWRNAFGGAGFNNNPLGKGFAQIETDDGKVHPLPNVELPRKLVKSKQDRPDPASFGPIDLVWPQRYAKSGTHDAKWLQTHFPSFAADMDWSIFNLAPEDQQQDAPFRGAEEFVIDGMHPTKPQLAGQLPKMATRCFVSQRAGDDETLQEIVMRLTTVWLFPHAERYLLIFHGVHEVAEEDAADILQIIIGAEDLGQRKPVEHYQQVLHLRLDPDKGAIRALSDSELMPAAPEINAAQDQAIAEMDALVETEGLLRKHERQRIEREIDERRLFLTSLGLDPDVHGPARLPPDEPPPSLEELPELAERAEADAARQQEEQSQRKAEVQEELREPLTAAGLDAEEIVSEPDQLPCGPPQFSAEKEIERFRVMSAECVAMGCPVEELDHYANDPERRRMMVETEQNMREGYRMTAHHQAPAPRFTGDEAAHTRAAALATFQSQGSLARLNLTGFDLSNLNLAGIDLSGAWLENANLTRTNLEGANLSEAVLARADLTETNLTGANLAKANLGLAQIVRTRADGAILSEAILSKANFDGASLRDAKLDSADLMEATYSATDMTGAMLSKTPFLKNDLRGLCLAGADLSQCTFLEADLSGVDFRGACLEKVNFVKCKGAGAVFAEAKMTKACFVQECVLEGADFRRAILEVACLRGAQLANADFSDARLAGADLSECVLERAKLDRVFARGALFIKSRLVEATLVGADLMNAILMNAEITGADLRGANLFGADLARVQKDERTQLEHANMKKARTVPERAPA